MHELEISTTIPPKLALINDYAGFGRIALAAAIPVVSTLGVQPIAIPTALFSNHTAYPSWSYLDLSAHMPEYIQGLEDIRLKFDGICCGFLGKKRQIQMVADFVDLHPESIFILDPVMADYGKYYSTVDAKYCKAMEKLISKAHILTPNVTEACLLCDKEDWLEDKDDVNQGWELSDLEYLGAHLLAMGPTAVVITGIKKGGSFINFIACKDQDGPIYRQIASLSKGSQRHGTGDIFSAIIAADAVKQVPLDVSVQKAADFISICAEASDKAGLPNQEGVLLENCLHYLSGII